MGTSGRRDWRTMSTDAIEGDPREFRQKFAICLPHDRFAARGEADLWIEETVALFDLKPESENESQVHTKASYQAKALL